MNILNLKVKHLIALMLFAIFPTWLVLKIAKPHLCTIFTAVQGETILFGDNWDYHEGELVIGFYPPSTNSYGSVHFGYQDGERQSYQRAVTDHGLAWAVNSVPKVKLNPHPEKPYSHAEDDYLSTISKSAATIEESIRIAQYFDFGDGMQL
jgi:hypothetical protein